MLHALQMRRRLLEGGEPSLARRISAFLLIGWWPLVCLSVLAPGSGASGWLNVDLTRHLRLLLALPVALAAEPLVDERIRFAFEEISRRLVDAAGRPALDRIAERTDEWMRSPLVQLALMAVAFLLRFFIAAPGPASSPAEWWYTMVSAPLVRFVLLRWLWRIGVWTWCLRSLSRLPLRLDAAHPDLCGGLGFLSRTQVAFTPVAFAFAVVWATGAHDQISYAGASMRSVELGFIGFAAFMALLLVGPVCFFTGRLVRVKRAALRRYDALAQTYLWRFDEKWFEGEPKEELLGTSDIQSLADLSNAYQVVRRMSFLPLRKEELLLLAMAVLVPAAVLSGSESLMTVVRKAFSPLL